MKIVTEQHVGSARFVRIKKKAALFKFGTQSDDDMEAARAIASAAIDRYGSWDDASSWDLYRKSGIWNDHEAVQAALMAIRMMRDELAPVGRWPHAIEPVSEPRGDIIDMGALVDEHERERYLKPATVIKPS